jgi:penicillin-binding protein 2
MKTVGIKRGVVIAMNPQTGEILALVSLPTYDNNVFARGISNDAFTKLLNNPDKPLTNHAIQAHYAPGSTYKLVAGTGALNDRKITARQRSRPRLLHDWRRGSTTEPPWLGPATSTAASGTSSDTFFFQMAASSASIA